MTSDLSFGPWLKQQRKACDLTQEALAERVGCATETIRKIEADRLRPSRELAERLAMKLAIPPEARPRFIQAARTTRSTARATVPEVVMPSQMLPVPACRADP